MERDLDKKLYNDYLNGEKEAFELLYSKYKGKIEYFIYNIVKDYQKAEDLTQETFIYVMQNKIKENCSFKYYIYLVAKSKAFNYISIENRRNEINEIYLTSNIEQIEKDVLDIITREETKKELLETIELLDDKYKNAIYLTNIEGLSYQETAKIIGQTLQNTKSLIHRGKKQLRMILLKKGFDEMNKIARVFVIILFVTISLTGVTFAGVTIYNTFIKKQDKIESRGLFDTGDGISTYETDLMANDMIWNEKSRIYHKLISNSEEYDKYKSRINQLPEMEEINFKENFIIILANENIRQMHEKDLIISDVSADEKSTHIKMKQKENPDYNNDNNIWYAIIDRSLLRDKADVTIENEKIESAEFINAEELPKDYSMESAINDGCIVLEDRKLKSNNIELLNKFIENTENGQNQFIRIYSKTNLFNNEDSIYIEDISSKNGVYYVNHYNLKGIGQSYLNSYMKIEKEDTSRGIVYSWKMNETMSSAFLIIQD